MFFFLKKKACFKKFLFSSNNPRLPPSASVRRMKQTFSSIGNDYTSRLSTIEELLSHKFSYRGYREHLHLITPPCIPYMGVYLTDLTFVLDGNPDRVEVRIVILLSHKSIAINIFKLYIYII